MANTHAQCFIEQSLDLRFSASQDTANWLTEKLVEGRKKLEESEARLLSYKKEYNIVAVEDKETIPTEKLITIHSSLMAAQFRRLEVETKLKELAQGRQIKEVLENGLIQSLKGHEVGLITQISEMSKKYGEKDPRMIKLNTELAHGPLSNGRRDGPCHPERQE